MQIVCKCVQMYGEQARKVLDGLLDKYVEDGVVSIEDTSAKAKASFRHGQPGGIGKGLWGRNRILNWLLRSLNRNYTELPKLGAVMGTQQSVGFLRIFKCID